MRIYRDKSVVVALKQSGKESSIGDVMVINSTGISQHDIQRYTDCVLQFTDFFVQTSDIIGNHCGVEILQHFVPDQEIVFSPYANCDLIIAKVSEQTKKFCLLFNDLPSKLLQMEETPHQRLVFKKISTEHSIFNVLAYRENLLPLRNWRQTWMKTYRNFSIEEILRFPSDFKKHLPVTCICDSEIGFVNPISSTNLMSAIILQGPYDQKMTGNSVKIFLEKNKKSLIIVSTYLPEGRSSTFLSEFENNIVTDNDHPDHNRIMYILSKPPSVERNPDFYRTNLLNQNLQRLTSFVALRHAKKLGIQLVLKTRTDAFLARTNVCEYLFEKYVRDNPIIPRFGDRQTLKGRLVTTDHTRDPFHKPRINREYFICDQVIFGYTQDLLGFFNMDPGSWWDEGRGIGTGDSVETNLTECWMKDQDIDHSIDGIAEIAARYMAVCGMLEIEYLCQKKQSYDLYVKNGYSHLEAIYKHYEEICGKFFKTADWIRWMGIIRCRERSFLADGETCHCCTYSLTM